MVLFDGPGNTFEFMLSDGKDTHYYDIFTLDKDTALQIGAKYFMESYGRVHTEVKLNCTGLPLTKNY